MAKPYAGTVRGAARPSTEGRMVAFISGILKAKPMIDETAAKRIVLELLHKNTPAGERFAVQSCALSERGDYWIIRANAEDFVRGLPVPCYVGVSAYIVDLHTGSLEIVGSLQNPEEYLQERYDLLEANGRHYVLAPAFDGADKVNLVKLKQKLECSYQHAIALLSPANRYWLTSKRRTLLLVQDVLAGEGIATHIELTDDARQASPVDHTSSNWSTLKAVLNNLHP